MRWRWSILATARAEAECRDTLSSSVLSPRRIRKALIGDSVAPVIQRRPILRTVLIRSVVPTTMPPSRSPCPPRYLVAECTMTSAPNSIGRCRAGVAKVLLTTTVAFALWAISRNPGDVDHPKIGVGRSFKKHDPSFIGERFRKRDPAELKSADRTARPNSG